MQMDESSPGERLGDDHVEGQDNKALINGPAAKKRRGDPVEMARAASKWRRGGWVWEVEVGPEAHQLATLARSLKATKGGDVLAARALQEAASLINPTTREGGARKTRAADNGAVRLSVDPRCILKVSSCVE